MTNVTLVKGVVLASLAAGPLVTSAMLLRDAPFTDWNANAFALALLVFFFSLFYGFALSLVPNMIGTMALASLGRRWRWARFPMLWAATGFALGTALQLGIAGPDTAGLGLPVTALVGARCALICRWGAEWSDA